MEAYETFLIQHSVETGGSKTSVVTLVHLSPSLLPMVREWQKEIVCTYAILYLYGVGNPLSVTKVTTGASGANQMIETCPARII
jgi:hypothetical protein